MLVLLMVRSGHQPQFYTVDFSHSRIGVQKCVSRTIKVCVNCSWQCPGTTAPSPSMYLCSSKSNAQGESKALEGHCVQQKSPSRVRDRDEGVAGRNGREKCFPDEGSLICPESKIEINPNQEFLTKKQKK